MDTVRFGRVLGQGARQAAKTLVSAVDAATAPNPHPKAPASGTPSSTSARSQSPSLPSPAPAQQRPATQARAASPTIVPPPASRARAVAGTTRGLAEGSRRFGRAVWAPAVRLSGVLWLELTGVFFGLFALVAAIASWRLRFAFFAAPASSAPPASDDKTRFFFAIGVMVVFAYFSLSSFLKANRRSRNS